MKQKIIAAALLLAVVQPLVLRSEAKAQGLDTNLVIGGVVAGCRDFRGVTVRTTTMDDLGDVARAWIVSRMPIITIDPVRMGSLPIKAQLFFYFHECGHHQLAHIFVPTTASESEADCWAVKKGRQEGLFTREEVAGLAPIFAHSRGSAAGHLPGPQRAAHLLACFDEPSDDVKPVEPAQSVTTLKSPAGGG